MDYYMDITDEIKEIIVSLIPERATVRPVNGSLFAYYVSWSNGSEAPLTKFFKPLVVQLSLETVIKFNHLILNEREMEIKKIRDSLESKFKNFTPDFNTPTDVDLPNIIWEI